MLLFTFTVLAHVSFRSEVRQRILLLITRINLVLTTMSKEIEAGSFYCFLFEQTVQAALQALKPSDSKLDLHSKGLTGASCELLQSFLEVPVLSKFLIF